MRSRQAAESDQMDLLLVVKVVQRRLPLAGWAAQMHSLLAERAAQRRLLLAERAAQMRLLLAVESDQMDSLLAAVSVDRMGLRLAVEEVDQRHSLLAAV